MFSLNNFLRLVLAWVLSGILAVFIGVVSQTQFVLARLGQLGETISLSSRLSMTFYDLHHLGSLYGVFLLIAFAIAFTVSALLYRIVKFGRPVIYGAAGGIAVFVLLFMMKAQFFNIHIISGARDLPGISLQVIAGVLAGSLFSKLTQSKVKTD